MNLIIVESPTKAKTLSRYLGKDYEVRATYGHIRDLPEKRLGVDVEKGYAPQYVTVVKQKDRIEELKKAGSQASKIYLATDPDREGEAIAWHVSQILDTKSPVYRASFHEITERAIKEALESPRKIDMQMVEAQQARRVLDRLVGYKLSPLLWKKVRKGLSAGRVQSVAVKLVVEREREIEAFKPEEYWILTVFLDTTQKARIAAMLVEKNDEKFKIDNETTATETVNELKVAAYQVADVERKEVKKSPPAPFTTSTLQQAGANRLGWSAKKTMQVAQMLYEEGFITYHRTDSFNLAVEAVQAAGRFITETYGREYALDLPRTYKTKSKVAQEAHEAIRPTDAWKRELHADSSNKDQMKLYELIWKRFVACQMAEARIANMKIIVEAKGMQNRYKLEAKGEKIIFDGWMSLYVSKSKEKLESDENNEENEGGEDGKQELPEVGTGERMEYIDLKNIQKFTQPPARYNDASLIKALEERGIGRPSTYAPILSTIQDRLYVEKIEKRFKPTTLGTAVNDFLVTNFPQVVDYGFTAKMEDELDEVANGDRAWQPVVGDFYTPLEKNLETANLTADRVKIEVETTGQKCPKCGEGEEVVRVGKFGKFLACSRYPECDYKSNYQEKAGVKCPKCQGDVILRKTKTRKSFYGCSNYPKCDFASWTKPVVKTENKVEGVNP